MKNEEKVSSTPVTCDDTIIKNIIKILKAEKGTNVFTCVVSDSLANLKIFLTLTINKEAVKPALAFCIRAYSHVKTLCQQTNACNKLNAMFSFNQFL